MRKLTKIGGGVGLAAVTIATMAIVPAANANIIIERGYRTVRQQPQADTAAVNRTVQLINDERSRNNKARLNVAGDLNTIAQNWAFEMGRSNTLKHNPNLSSQVTNYRLVGENVGVGANADQIHGAFMGSSGHRANILRSEFNQVGVGAYYANGRLWVVQVFRQSR